MKRIEMPVSPRIIATFNDLNSQVSLVREALACDRCDGAALAAMVCEVDRLAYTLKTAVLTEVLTPAGWREEAPVGGS